MDFVAVIVMFYASLAPLHGMSGSVYSSSFPVDFHP